MDGSKSARVRMVRREGVQRWEGGMVASPSLRTIPPLRALLYWQGRIRGVLLGRGPCRREAPGMKNEYKQLLSHLMPNSAFSKAMDLYLELFVCSSVCPSRIGTYPLSPLYDFQTIQTIYFLWGYDPGNMSVSFIAELSPVYCCLVVIYFLLLGNVPGQSVLNVVVNAIGFLVRPFQLSGLK